MEENKKTADNCKDIFLNIKEKIEIEFDCKVTSVETDNARNMQKMRESIEEETNVITY